MHVGVARGEKRQRVDEILMPLDRIQIAYRHQQLIVWPELQFIPQCRPARLQVGHAVGNHRNARPRDAQVASHIIGQAAGDGHRPPAERDCGAHCQTTAEPACIIAAAVHRDDVGDPGASCGPCPV